MRASSMRTSCCGADLVLTATTEHRAHAVGLAPSVVRRTFTLKEFARLAKALPATDVTRPPGKTQQAAINLRAQALANVKQRVSFVGWLPDPARAKTMLWTLWGRRRRFTTSGPLRSSRPVRRLLICC